jgi:hypothetical protein
MTTDISGDELARYRGAVTARGLIAERVDRLCRDISKVRDYALNPRVPSVKKNRDMPLLIAALERDAESLRRVVMDDAAKCQDIGSGVCETSERRVGR